MESVKKKVKVEDQNKDQEVEEAYPEEHNEIVRAALLLVCQKYSAPAEGFSVLLKRPNVPSLEGIIGKCSEPFGKELTKSDINGAQSRLLINKADAQTHIYPFLGQNREAKMKEGVAVKVFNEQGKEFKMLLKTWSGNDKSNVLTTGWTVFVKHMGLECEVDYITLWAFCHIQSGDLCFLIAVRRKNGVGKLQNQSSGAANILTKKADNL